MKIKNIAIGGIGLIIIVMIISGVQSHKIQNFIPDILCDNGVGTECNKLGLMYLGGDKVEKDETMAYIYFVTSCYDANNAIGCGMLGSFYEKDHEYSDAFSLYEKSCKDGYMGGCVSLGSMYEHGKGIKKDYSKSVRLYSKACDNNIPQGCRHLGSMYKEGNGVKKNDFKAAELFNEACNSGDIKKGCTLLGLMYTYGYGIEKNDIKAVELYTRACNAGDVGACSLLGSMYRDGRGIEQNKAIAKQLYGKACDAGYPNGCKKYAEISNN